jgi:periplasmic divalent cation tolerance protein
LIKMSELCQFWLTCASAEEANKIGRMLLNKKLVVCTKQIQLKAEYWWKGKIEVADEVLLIMESREEFFGQIEAEVAKLHSYDTFVLEAVPINEISTKARAWVEDEFGSSE